MISCNTITTSVLTYRIGTTIKNLIDFLLISPSKNTSNYVAAAQHAYYVEYSYTTAHSCLNKSIYDDENLYDDSSHGKQRLASLLFVNVFFSIKEGRKTGHCFE